MEIKKININKGLVLNIIPADKFKTNYFSVQFSLPVTRENASLSSLLPKVLMRGCEDFPSMKDINRRLDDLYAAEVYGRVYSRGETQFFGIAADMLRNNLCPDGTDVTGGVFSLIHSLIFRPCTENGAFRADYTESEKKQLRAAIESGKNNKRRYAIKRCEEEMCKDEPYGIPTYGYPEDIDGITPEALYAFYRDTLTKTRCEIYFVGKTDEDELIHKVKKLFGHLGRDACGAFECNVVRQAGKVKEITESFPMEQSKLSLGFRTGTVLSDGTWHIFSVFSEIFGGSATSKLFMNVREKLSLCYYCSCVSEAHKGIMVVYSGINACNRDKAQTEILAQLDAVKKGEISEDELESAKLCVINSYRAISDSPSTMEGWCTGRRLAGISTMPEECIELVRTVTAEDVVNIAKKITLDTVYFMEAEKND